MSCNKKHFIINIYLFILNLLIFIGGNIWKVENGISLIVLIITIIVIIILAGAVILNLSKNNPIDSAKKASFLNDVSGFRDQLELYKGTEFTNNLGDYESQKLQADDISVTYGSTVYSDKNIGDIIPALKNSKKYYGQFKIINGKLVYLGSDKNMQEWAEDNGVDIVPGSGSELSKNINKPMLTSGLTAKKWSGSEWVTVSNPENDTSWYDYANKQWANAQTADGSMWVWIPRYEYKIPIPHSSTAQTIQVNFINGTNTTTTSGYILHPAFTFGSTELTGIWVAKFEASGTTNAVNIKPNVISLRNISVDAIFTACRNMETNSRYGWGTVGSGIDTHLMKNVEWGAVAYLSSSIYGKTGEIWTNPENNYVTGRAGKNVSDSYKYVTYVYDNITCGVNASTTGNIYGVYDMSGGSWEFTAAYLNDRNISTLTENGLSLLNSDIKYKDVYTITEESMGSQYLSTSNKVGDSIYETSINGSGYTSWYEDYSEMPYFSQAFFLRGGGLNEGTNSGIFSFDCNGGNANGFSSFRPVLAVSDEL